MPHDYGLFTNNKSNVENRPWLTKIENQSIEENIDFIMSHFNIQHEIFPRTIMTGDIKYQLKIEYETDGQLIMKKIIDYFKRSNFVDCKINAFPLNTRYNSVDFEVKNRCAANFIMIDLDLEHFENKEEKLDKILNKVLKKMSLKFNGEAHPTVLWTGNGYHIYQPVNGIVFEQIQAFYDFLPYLDGKDLTTEFIRFAEKFLSSGKADPKHLPSINSCLIRIPGTTNSKNGERVKLIQQWNGFAPNIRYIVSDFFDYLIDKRNKNFRERMRQKELRSKYTFSFNYPNNSSIQRIEWIEKLLQSPLSDHRKTCLWRILCPYLNNVRKLSVEETTAILEKWLEKCDDQRKTDFDHQVLIKNNLRHVSSYFPPSRDRLKNNIPQLYATLKAKKIFG